MLNLLSVDFVSVMHVRLLEYAEPRRFKVKTLNKYSVLGFRLVTSISFMFMVVLFQFGSSNVSNSKSFERLY